MLTFLRSIRRQHLKDSKLSKYFAYAIGEIVLVVIGILIALSINNYNEELKKRDKELEILKQLKDEFTLNQSQLEEKILMRNEGLEAAAKILSYFDNREIFDKTAFYQALWKLVRDPTFDPIENDIIGTENLRILTNAEIIQQLSRWSSDVYQVQELELEYQKFRSSQLSPKLNALGLGRNIQNELWKNGYTPVEALDKQANYQQNIGESSSKINYDKVLRDAELEGMITNSITFHRITNLQSDYLRNVITKTLELIDSEIERF